MFKKIIHYFTSRSLEKHRTRTQCMIDEYEQAVASSQDRIKVRSEGYARELQDFTTKRENEIKQYIEFLNTHLTNTTEHVAQLKLLTEMMFMCVQDGMDVLLIEQRFHLQKEKYEIVRSNKDLIEEFRREIVNLSQEKDRQEWRKLIADRPPRVSTPKIEKHIRDSENTLNADSQGYQQELRRIDSHITYLRKQLRDISSSKRNILLTELNPAQEKLKKSRIDLGATYATCCSSWGDLQKSFESYFQNTNSDSDMANNWISKLPEGGTLIEIRQVIVQTDSEWKEAKDNLSGLQERMASIKVRIKRAHDMQEYAALDSNKRERASIFNSIRSAIEHKQEIYEARHVFFTRRDEINKFMEWINRFHPSNTVEQIYKVLSQDGDNLYWKAIGLRTKKIKSQPRFNK